LRKQSTEAEKKLWQKLRRKQFQGLRFRRQYPLGPYFGDFVCLPARLVVEVDGASHTDFDQVQHDERRTHWLVSQNFHVLRFWNSDIFENIDGVIERIDAVMRESPFPPTPSREGRGLNASGK
jgi:very-short-patch-repair endonuclease